MLEHEEESIVNIEKKRGQGIAGEPKKIRSQARVP